MISPVKKYMTCLFQLLPLLLFSQAAPLPNAHAHNDYEHERPLLDALDQGFTSIEVDVHLIDGQLFVYHDHPESTAPERTLENLYLAPLSKRIEQHNGRVYPAYEGQFFLMIDFKTEAPSTYTVLKPLLKKYKKYLSFSKGDRLTQKAVTIFLSGNRPVEMVLAEKKRWVGIDGRPADLGKGYSAAFMPVVSDHYRNHLQWRGYEDITAKELAHLRELVRRTHTEGKKLRLWASPENEEVWEVLLEEGVDLINTDQLKELRSFLTEED